MLLVVVSVSRLLAFGYQKLARRDAMLGTNAVIMHLPSLGASQTICNFEVEACKEVGPPSLTSIQHTSILKVGKVLVVTEYGDLMRGSLQKMPPLLLEIRY